MCAKSSETIGQKILVTGGAGFIGSAFVRQMSRAGRSVCVVDKLTYAGDIRRLAAAKGCYEFFKADIGDRARMRAIFGRVRPSVVVNFAAETHVDRSIRDAAVFLDTNIKGVQVLLDCAREAGTAKFVHISTDEVYGDIAKGSFTEESPLKASSPYAASKAAADLLIQSYIRTHKVNAVIIRPCNNYGPWQYPEKLLPRSILTVLGGKNIPVYGKGANVREWLFVEDCALGISMIMEKGGIGRIYNLGSSYESRNIDTVKMLLRELGAPPGMFEFVRDRPGHDIRYSLDSGRARREVGWKATTDLREGIAKTVAWCRAHRQWLESKEREVSEFYAQGK